VSVAEVGEDDGYVVAVADVSEQVEGVGVLVAVDGLVVVAEVVGVAEAVPRVRLPEAVAELLAQREGLC
jgi:hypothetical protein